MWWWCIAAGCEIVHLKMITYGIHYSVHYWSKKNAHDNSQQKKLWTDMNPSNIRVLVWYKCKNGTEAWLLLKILFQLPSMTNLCYKMRWQQYEENITRGSLLYTILFIKQVTPACSRWTAEVAWDVGTSLICFWNQTLCQQNLFHHKIILYVCIIKCFHKLGRTVYKTGSPWW